MRPPDTYRPARRDAARRAVKLAKKDGAKIKFRDAWRVVQSAYAARVRDPKPAPDA